MSGVIYLRHGDGLVPMTEAAYDSEDILQRLLADYPNLLAGEQVNAAAPRRWLLVAREAGLPSEEGGTDRWSIDHLFLDQDGIPTIIEVKRSSDSRIRREVVGQMLDYAANAVVYWPVETLRAKFEAWCESNDIDAEQRILETLEIDTDIEVFWQQVKTNLQAGRVRMIFVADFVPDELRRVVEFLNGQMNPAEVLAVEVKQYVGQGQQALVPRVIGQTQAAVAQKTAGTSGIRVKRSWDATSFFTALRAEQGDEVANVVKRIYDWAASRNLAPAWGEGQFSGSYYPLLVPGDKKSRLLAIWTDGTLYFEYWRIKNLLPLESDERIQEMVYRVVETDDGGLPHKRTGSGMTVQLKSFREDEIVEVFISGLDRLVEELRKQ